MTAEAVYDFAAKFLLFCIGCLAAVAGFGLRSVRQAFEDAQKELKKSDQAQWKDLHSMDKRLVRVEGNLENLCQNLEKLSEQLTAEVEKFDRASHRRN